MKFLISDRRDGLGCSDFQFLPLNFSRARMEHFQHQILFSDSDMSSRTFPRRLGGLKIKSSVPA